MKTAAEIKAQAEKEVREELERAAIEKYKTELRTKKPLWHKIMPYKLVIIRR